MDCWLKAKLQYPCDSFSVTWESHHIQRYRLLLVFSDFHPDFSERKVKNADLTGEIADRFLPFFPQSAIGKNGKPFLSLPVLVIILKLIVILILGRILYHLVGRL
jgi:hypothetical protein